MGKIGPEQGGRSAPMERPRILLMGCGGIGGVIGASLFEHGNDVVAVTHNAAITEALHARGFEVHSEKGTRVVAGRAWTAIPPGVGPFDFVLLATQPPQVLEATQSALPFLHPGSAVVCFQNGLCEQLVAPLVGSERVIGAIVAWGGTMSAPGVYERTSDGGFVLGRLDGGDDPRFKQLRSLFQPIGPVSITHNLVGARWSKLAINCAISSLGTIGGRRLGELIRYRFIRRLALEVMTEVVEVAKRAGVELEKVAGTIDLAWVALTPDDVSGPGSPSLLAKHALLLAVGAKFRRLRSSMLAAIERGRDPAVDYLNGEVVRRAESFGMTVPLNRRVQVIVHEIARGRSRPSIALLQQLYRESRAEVYAATAGGYRGAEERSHDLSQGCYLL